MMESLENADKKSWKSSESIGNYGNKAEMLEKWNGILF